MAWTVLCVLVLAASSGSPASGSGSGASAQSGRSALRATPHPAAMPTDVASGSTPAVRFRWPLDGAPRLARRFEPPPQPWLPGHRGVDLIAAPGAVVRAAGPGVVLFAGQVAGRPVITVGHSAGLRTTYEPVLPGVRAGDRLTVGAPLGRLGVGHVGCPDRACLHWGLRRGEEYLDPMALLGLGPVRLLPH
ncbi:MULTISPECIES: murein hydrolase activator EnvC family protein [unclassified Micromonospora]|uniref:murein hydrolase activator EnvC family protein n=1 Tax=unclassified Micromonospora TaxID=2617518 RepID=UPI0036298E3A